MRVQPGAEMTVALDHSRRVLKVIGSSDKVHEVDALAITGEEGRGSLRKAAGSWQTSFDPQISEWGNPPLHRWLSQTRWCKPRSVQRVMYAGVAQAESIGLERRTR
jgi:hypothetical protein